MIRKLRPVLFNWKDGGVADMGLVAEEVNEVEPLTAGTLIQNFGAVTDIPVPNAFIR